MHIDFLRHLRDAVRRDCPERWRTNSWFLLHDNTPAHRSVLVKDSFSKQLRDNTGALPCLAPADFYMFPRLKSALKGWSFCAARDIINNATEELKRLSQNGLFPTPLQSLAEIYSCKRRLL